MNVKSTILNKLASKLVERTVATEINIQDLDVKIKNDNVVVDFQGTVEIPKSELLKLIFEA